MPLKEEEFALLRELAHLQSERRLNVETLASALGMSPSLLVRKLRALLDGGWVVREQASAIHGRIVRYLPAPRLSVQWVSPRRGVAIAWETSGEVDWDFPLVTQLLDLPSRETIRRFLWELRKKGILDIESHWSGDMVVREDAVRPLTVVVYGSAARGDARADSDVDVLVFAERPGGESKGAWQAFDDEVHDAAAATALAAPRPIQIQVIRTTEAENLAPEIARAVREDGIIVFDSMDWEHLWRTIYGSRSA